MVETAIVIMYHYVYKCVINIVYFIIIYNYVKMEIYFSC